jgi:hypothetical protein
MTALIKKLNAPTLRDRLQKLPAGNGGPLAQKVAQRLYTQRVEREECLLLDVSGSMAEDCGDGRAKIDALREIARDFAHVRQFCFSCDCVESRPAAAGGNTDMALAFSTVKARGVRHVVLITDGMPDSEPAALAAAAGLKIDIIYVGPPPEPPFLARLAALTGGQYGAGSLAQQKQITAQVKALLALPAPK